MYTAYDGPDVFVVPSSFLDHMPTLTDTEVRVLLAALHFTYSPMVSGVFTSRDVMGRVKRAPRYVTAALTALTERGYLHRTPKGRGWLYTLAGGPCHD